MTREIADLIKPCKAATSPALPNPSSICPPPHDQIQALPPCVSHKSVLWLLAHPSAAFITFVQLGHSTWGHETGPNSTHYGVAGGVHHGLHPSVRRREAHCPRCPPTITHRALEVWSRGPYFTCITPIPAHGFLLPLLLPLPHRWVGLKDVASLLNCSLSESSVSLILLLEPSWISRFKCTSQDE